MNCGQVREYLFAFLDNELDAPLSIELQRHLDGCAVCACEAEIERTVHRRLALRFDRDAGHIADFDSAKGALFATASSDGVSKRVYHARLKWSARRVVLVATAAALGMATGAWLFVSGRSGAHGNVRLADALVGDFEHFLTEGRAVQIASADHRQVVEWLRRRTALAVVLPVANGPRWALIGGRRCTINGRSAAFAAYDVDGTPAALAALAVRPGDLEGMNEVRHGGTSHWVDRCHGFTVVARRRGGLVYAAVSTLPQEELMVLLSDMNHEAD